jgi:hypothetical protein
MPAPGGWRQVELNDLGGLSFTGDYAVTAVSPAQNMSAR